ncbi:MAG: hypothetical protein ACI4FZ_09925 [Lachnospiraceae bacterium]
MKKIGIIAVLFTAICMMGGCLQDVPLTDSEMDIVAEYAARALLESMPEYQPMLLPKEDAMPTPTIISTPVPTKQPEATEKPAPTKGAEISAGTPAPTATPRPDNAEFTNRELTSVVGVDGFALSYEEGDYELATSVQCGDYFSLDAKDGRQYLLVYFTAVNVSNESRGFDTTEKKLECAVDINLGTISRASLSMMENDLQYMNGSRQIAPGESVETVLVFEISALEEINTAHVRITNQNEETVIIKLK